MLGFERGERYRISLSTGEVTGAVGDAATVLPFVVALGVQPEVPLGAVFLGFGVFQIVWGVVYGLPLSVEPMKALAALAVAGGLAYAELVWAGLLAGAVLLVVGTTGTLDRVERYVGEPVVRGVQLGVALLLVETGVSMGIGDPVLAAGGVALAGVTVLAGLRRASALAVIAAGFVLAFGAVGVPDPRLPAVVPVALDPAALSAATLSGTAAQLAMTVGNAAIATSLLLSDYFDADLSGDSLARNMGVMNLLAVPLGALPMCHGSGGLAGKYAFGARTGGANLVLGAGYVLAALVLTTSLLSAFPTPILGVVLVVVGLELARAGLRSDALWLSGGVAAVSVVTSVGVGFLAGALAWTVLRRRESERAAV